MAGQLLEKAYDRPRFNPRELKREFTDADAKKVFHGLFARTATSADNSARENFAPGLGLVAKNNPATFAPQPESAAAHIQERVAAQMDIAVAELVRELCGCPYGMTESMVQLAILCAVRAAQPAIVLAYAQVLDANLTPAHTPDEEVERNRELCLALTNLKAELPTVRETLRKLAGVLGGALPQDATEVFARLETIAETGDYQEFHAEEQVDDLLRKLRGRFQAEFDKAKKETAGKKRIRFFLK